MTVRKSAYHRTDCELVKCMWRHGKEQHNLTAGLPQAFFLDPLLLSLYTRILGTVIQTVLYPCYADDTQLFWHYTCLTLRLRHTLLLALPMIKNSGVGLQGSERNCSFLAEALSKPLQSSASGHLAIQSFRRPWGCTSWSRMVEWGTSKSQDNRLAGYLPPQVKNPPFQTTSQPLTAPTCVLSSEKWHPYYILLGSKKIP